MVRSKRSDSLSGKRNRIRGEKKKRLICEGKLFQS